MKKHNRTYNYLKQIKISFLFKILTILLSFFIIKMMVLYLGKDIFGVWTILFTALSWILLFDIGFSNGLKNKVSESLTKNNIKLTNIYISTTYITLIIISILIYAIIYIISYFIPWQIVFNTELVSNFELQSTVLLLLFFILVNFILSIVFNLFHAIQKSAYVTMAQFTTNLFVLIIVFFIQKIFEGSLFILALAYGCSLLISSMIFTIVFFSKNKQLRLKFKLFKLYALKNISMLGFKFFIIQIVALIIFTTDKIIIAHLFSTSDVTDYELIFKVLSVVTIIHSIVISPLWSTFTEANLNKDFLWINNILRKLNMLMIPLAVFLSILIIFMNDIINIWIGIDFNLDQKLVYMIGLYVMITIWSGTYSTFLNGINLINLQLFTAILAGIINIPLSIYLGKYYFESSTGVVLGSILSLSIFAIIGPIQTLLYLHKNKKNHNEVCKEVLIKDTL